MDMVKIRGLQYISSVGENPTLVLFENPISLTNACAEMIRLNNEENTRASTGIYYMDESCRVVSTDLAFETLWCPQSMPKA